MAGQSALQFIVSSRFLNRVDRVALQLQNGLANRRLKLSDLTVTCK